MISSEHGVWESCKMSSTGGERKRGQSGEFASRVKAIVSNYPFTRQPCQTHHSLLGMQRLVA